MRAATTVVVLLTVLLAGCASQKGIVTQEKPRGLDDLRIGDDLVKGPIPQRLSGTKAWWLAYGDAQLDTLIGQALRDSPDLALTRARIREAAGVAQASGATLVPEVNGNAQIGRAHWTEDQFFPPPFGGSTTWNNVLNLQASYAIDLWGQHHAAHRAAIDDVHRRQAEAAAARLLLVTDLVRQYLRYARLLAERDQIDRLDQVQRQVLHIERVRLAHGLTDARQVHDAEQALARIDNQRAALTGALKATGEQIAILTGAGVATRQPLARPMLVIEPGWHVPHQVPAELIGQRPDVAARRVAVEAAAERIHVARAAFYPNINLAAYLGGLAAAGTFVQFLKPGAAHYGVTTAITLPIFEGGRLRGQLRARTADYDAAVANYNRTLLTALVQAAKAITRVHTLAERQQALDRETLAARANAERAQRQFHAGLTNRLPVLQADGQLIQLRQQAISLDADALDSLTVLYAALGGTVVPGTLPHENPAP